jgi:disulfide bond formation protein DsbB
MKKLLTAAALLTLILAFISSAHAYTSTTYGFTIDPPIGWTTTEPAYAAVVFTGPTDQGYTVNINIQVETTSLTLDQFVQESKQSLQVVPDYVNISETTRTINGNDAYEIVYTFTATSITLKQKQVMLIINEKAYVIIYSAKQTTYPTYLPTFENTLQTFNTTTDQGNIFGLDWRLWAIIIIIIVAVTITIAMLMRRKKPPTKPPRPKRT